MRGIIATLVTVTNVAMGEYRGRYDYSPELREAKDRTQLDYGELEHWMVKLPPPEFEAAGDEFPDLLEDSNPMPNCPSTGGNMTGINGTVTQTLFYDFVLELGDGSTHLDSNASQTLMAEMFKYYNAFFTSSCPLANATVTDIFRFVTQDVDGGRRLQITRRLKPGKNAMATTGRYNPPPRVAMDELIGESINGGDMMRRKLVEGSSPIDAYLTMSFAQRLNLTSAFSGRVVGTTVPMETMKSCNTDQETCCNHINYRATCDNPSEPSSLCPLNCCCKFPDAPCCQSIFFQRKCDLGNFCFNEPLGPTPSPTWYRREKVDFPAERMIPLN